MSNDKQKKEAEELFEYIKGQRDDLRVQAHLAKLELKDKWKETEDKWHHFAAKFHSLSRGTDKATDDVAEGFKHLGEELKHAYNDLKQSVKSKDSTD
ncbi:hypothetical protein [Kangiella shandongensis]|uniref:hypothetical protein n=1 Tax=Kangiella shandongensis TaxID=2763258 RepID=UPI001CBF7C60|nr:hypothetical protein [Kangiella shandongensis]